MELESQTFGIPETRRLKNSYRRRVKAVLVLSTLGAIMEASEARITSLKSAVQVKS